MKLQAMLIIPLIHTKGYAALETIAAVQRASLLIEQAKAIGEPPEDPLLLFAVLGGSFAANVLAGKVEACHDVATRMLDLAEKQQASAPLVIGLHHVGASLMLAGEIAKGKAYFDQAIELYVPAEHRPLMAHFGQDLGVSALIVRSIALWMLGSPDAAFADADRAVKGAGAIGHTASSMYALAMADLTHMLCGNYVAGGECRRALAALADEKGSLYWKIVEQSIEARHSDWRPGKGTSHVDRCAKCFPLNRSKLPSSFRFVRACQSYAVLGKFDDAWRCIAEALNTIKTNQEKWFEVEVNRIAGEVARKSPAPHTAKAAEYFEHAIDVARQQQTKSWELRAAMSLARLWRDQGKPQQARELLAPVYGWFTEGFDTRDLKEAKALLGELT
jgi:tetratricopeptide (TPR) repeat protein